LVILLAAVLAAGTAAVAAIYLKPSLLARQKPDLSALRASAVTPGLLGLSAAAIVAMVVRGVRLWRRDARRLGPLAGWAALASFVLGGSLAFRALDGFKNLHRMTADLVTLGAASPSLVGYHMDEVTQGIIPFDTGMMPRNLADPAELRRHILANPSGKLLTLERHVHEFPDDLRSRLRLVRSWSYGSHRAYALYEISAAPPEE
jgi:hypothetical protein